MVITREARSKFIFATMAYLGDVTALGTDARDHLRRVRAAIATDTFRSAHGTWDVVWGPVVRRFSVGSLHLPSRNTFLVLHNAAKNEQS